MDPDNPLTPVSIALDADKRLEALCLRIIEFTSSAKSQIARTINHAMIQTYWFIGKEIVEEELEGKSRFGYGEQLLETLSKRLRQKLGKGYTVSNLRAMRRFYLAYPPPIQHALRVESLSKLELPDLNPNLAWTHYRLLISVARAEARSFYEKEASNNHWSSRELERQIGSLLFERLSKSKDKAGLLRLAQEGQEIQSAEDVIKDPVVLEFLGLPESHLLVESKLEEALLNHLQQFLLELGKGFAFVARQKRITLEGDHFYVDLVFYHTLLKCYVLVDLKVKALTHGDLGQMQLYVNFFDQHYRSEGDNPTIGLILCIQKNDAMVKYTLGEKEQQIFASKYQFHLPTEDELVNEIKKELLTSAIFSLPIFESAQTVGFF